MLNGRLFHLTITAAACFTTCSLIPTYAAQRDDKHGGIAMGVSKYGCDDGKHGIKIDWDGSSVEYHCPLQEPFPVFKEVLPVEFCKKKLDKPLHKCLNEEIIYIEHPPTDGPHRPLWPVYGEYRYLPPQRWVHSLEHGAAVFLYHPCAEPGVIDLFKSIARSCLRKHIITPYRFLPEERPFAVVTYGCKLLMSYINQDIIIAFIKAHAPNAPEWLETRDGHFNEELTVKAKIVSDLKDSRLCPFWDDRKVTTSNIL
ncbi:uncharacterized protein LOC106151617 [Lingula anatina]|uniref:Uncharacterized protein LOC106151617 n=1 Tax=Lingula anatina TaxID=7574 RepID=A0A1S3H393_LINAN|nr:uncharacterized protein LOC106151617 [Lingula anatina]XP_013380423.1 uncharacterized protein LOC106151617 [Lingula anatina]|eukprot:XP_013380422.1 uncharacterized protein LOC106151617 [Lingula anatina]